MYSLEWLLSVLGDPAFGDRLERITFNALPATFSPDMWSHQYDQQVNQIECSVRRRNWNTNDDDSNIFGLEPNYGCCTANLSQGWPKFAAHLWMAADDGLAAVAYAPSEVATTIRGQTVRVRLETDYPFSDTLHFTVQPGSAHKFPLLLRIPLWAAGAHVTVNGGATQPALPGKFHRIEREWREGDTVLLTLPMRPVVHPRPRQTVAVSRGPLLYALKIGEEWRRIHADQPQRELPHGDWEIYPTTPWNYALAIDRAHPERSLTFEQRPMTGLPFAPDRAPVAAHVKGKRVPGWQEASGSAPMWPAARRLRRAAGGSPDPLRLHQPALGRVPAAGVRRGKGTERLQERQPCRSPAKQRHPCRSSRRSTALVKKNSICRKAGVLKKDVHNR